MRTAASLVLMLVIGVFERARAAGPPSAAPLVVVVDMDTTAPGIQSTIQVRACEPTLSGIAIYIYDPQQSHEIWSVGYVGGIDRGIAFGHTKSNQNIGTITTIDGTPGTPANPGNTPWVVPGFIPLFDGGEIHYLENGAAQPAIIASRPMVPVCTINLEISDAHAGDQFHFYLLDYVSVWSGGSHGAFSVSGAINALDAGGDSVPDQTATTQGVDPDQPVPSPPAPFLVDYVDGPLTGEGAVVVIIPRLGDVNGDNLTNVSDLLSIINGWGPCSPPPVAGNCPADLNGDGIVNVNDLRIVINNWGGC